MATTTRSGVQDYGKAASDTAETALEGVRSARDSATTAAASIADQAKAAAEPIIDQAKAAAGPVIDTVRERTRELNEQAQDMAGEAYQRGQHTVRAVNRQIEERPLVTALAAFAIGYGVSYLLHGQR